ncbi:MAG: hypothetical protein IJC21_05850, partial [Lentisphaeria bacterium]|nr:hypothetical protein [Lentisphaeria bacterium]
LPAPLSPFQEKRRNLLFTFTCQCREQSKKKRMNMLHTFLPNFSKKRRPKQTNGSTVTYRFSLHTFFSRRKKKKRMNMLHTFLPSFFLKSADQSRPTGLLRYTAFLCILSFLVEKKVWSQ